MKIKAFAKINLALKITGILDGGYHELSMINLPLNIFDELDIAVYGTDSLTKVVCDALPDLPQEKNLCYKAVCLMRNIYHFTENVEITIEKNIPSQAGLGGGSSDAAATISALNSILGLNMSQSEMDSIGLQIGSDTPYFFRNTACLLKGRGEVITPVVNNSNLYCLLVKPECGLSTKDVYAISDTTVKQNIDIDGVLSALADNSLNKISDLRGNDLESAAIQLLPEIALIIEKLRNYNGCVVGMSGSGSTVFAISDSLEVLKGIYRNVKNDYWSAITKVL